MSLHGLLDAVVKDPALAEAIRAGADGNRMHVDLVGPQAARPFAVAALARETGRPVLALLTTAKTQQGSGDFNGAASSLERAQRIAPREPQVLYRLAQVRLSQGDAPQAEQLARRALTYANGRPSLQAELWNTIAQAREKQGDSAGAALARQKARVNS